MISIEHIFEFAEAAMSADYSRLRKAGQQLTKEIEPTDPEAAKRLRTLLGRKGVTLQASGFTEMLPIDSKSRLPLLEEHQWPIGPVFIDAVGNDQLHSFLLDVNHLDLLAAKGVASRLSLMLSGPPGTGKTLLAGHVAAQLGKKLYVARLDSLISSLLGDTAKNIRSIFDFIAGKNAVLFLDELDAVAKMRDDRNELGELKRVVNTVIQGIDSLDDKAIVIAATNHSQMLDKAIWRRFSYKIEFELPDCDMREEMWRHFLQVEDDLNIYARALASISAGMSGADIEQSAFAARRRSIIDNSPIDYVSLAATVLGQSCDEWGELRKDSPEVRKKMARIFVKKYELAQADVARFFGITRQAVSSYLKVSDG